MCVLDEIVIQFNSDGSNYFVVGSVANTIELFIVYVKRVNLTFEVRTALALFQNNQNISAYSAGRSIAAILI